MKATVIFKCVGKKNKVFVFDSRQEARKFKESAMAMDHVESVTINHLGRHRVNYALIEISK